MFEELVDRIHSLLFGTPIVRRFAPRLASGWHEIDSSDALYELRRTAWQLRHGRRTRFPLRVAFTPEAPRYFHGAYQLCERLNVELVAVSEAEVLIHWRNGTTWGEPPTGLDARAINARVRDISKRHVNEVHGKVFGYDLEPEADATEFVAKSDRNATHDGRIVARRSDEAGVVTQRLIDNRLDEHMVTDFRVVLMDGRIVLCVVRYRPATNRFLGQGFSLLAVLTEPAASFSSVERAQLAAMCDAVGADWAELDVLRDRASGRLYVVDVNPTPGAPIPSLSPDEHRACWRLQEAGFAALLRGHAL
jgi:hypothetical protein